MARIRVDKVGEFGLVNDPDSPEIPLNAWTRSVNVDFIYGAAQNAKGWATVDTPTDPATYLLGQDFGGTYYLVYPGTDAIYSWTGLSETEITHTAGAYTATSPWNGCVLGGVVVLNNYSDCPQYWGGTGDCQDLIYDGSTTWDDAGGSEVEYRAKVIRSFRSFLFALGISDNGTEYPYMVHWSNPADPGTIPDSWDYTNPANLSGRFDLADSPGYVVDALPLRDVFVIYKEDAVWLASYVGGQYQFRFDKLADASGLGLYSTNCAIDIGGRHVVMGDSEVYIHDGVQVQSILKGRAAEQLYGSIDQGNYELTYLAHDFKHQEVLICYPPVGSSICTRAFVFNYKNNTWSWREIPDSYYATPGVVSDTASPSWPDDSSGGGWDDDSTLSWDTARYSSNADTLLFAGTTLAKITELADFGGANPSCTLERTGLRFGEGGQMSLVRAVYPRMSGDPVQIQVGSQLSIDADVSWQSAQTFTPGTTRKVDFTSSGELHAIRITSTDGGSWRLNGYELDIEFIGSY